MWLGLAAAIVLVALAGVTAVLTAREFEEREARILGTALVALLAGGAAFAGAVTALEEPRRPVGWAVLAVAPVAALALLVAIWWEEGWDRDGERMGRVVLSAIALLVAALIVGTLRRALRLELSVIRVAFWATAMLVGLTAVFAVAAIWVPSVEEVGRQTRDIELVERALLALFVAIVAAFLLLPALERALALRGGHWRNRR